MAVAADSANKAVESVDLSVSKALREDNMYLHAGIGRKGRGCCSESTVSGLVTYASVTRPRELLPLATSR